jgi:hypothetical protein
VRVVAGVVCLAVGLSGCYGWEQRHGIDPILDPVAVRAATTNQIVILNALAEDAGLGLGGPASWYMVSQAGFNFVDDQCRAYFNHLFFLNRDRERNKSFLINGAATAAAILGVTGASQLTMTVVAEAFGFGGIANEAIAGTYLYQLPPASTLAFVREMQLAYREGAASRRDLISSAPAAYNVIQDYLSLCLPPTIEAKMAEHIAGARATPDPSGAPTPSFGLTLSAAPPVTRGEVRMAAGLPASPPIVRESIIERSVAPLAKRQPLPAEKKDDLERVFLTQIQKSLCVSRITGVLDDATRAEVREYLIARGENPTTAVDIRNRIIRPRLETAIDEVPSCKAEGFASGFEVGAYGVGDRLKNIKTMQERVAIMLQRRGSQTAIKVTGEFDQQTRDAIKALRGDNMDRIDSALGASIAGIRLRTITPTNGTTIPPVGPAPVTPATPGPTGPGQPKQ